MTSVRIFIAVFLLSACAPAAFAVDELEVWWEFRGGGAERSWAGSGFSYLPDFDTLNGGAGQNAIAIVSGIARNDTQSTAETWYLRYAGDREDQFEWEGGEARGIAFGDLDGDGVRDYMSWAGRVFRGRVNGLPPDTPWVAEYRSMFVDPVAVYPQVLDLNRDGYDDVFFRSGTLFDEVGRILLGGPDLTALQVGVIADNYPAYLTEEFFIGFPRTPSRRGRQTLVTQVAQMDTGPFIEAVEVSFVLWELNFRRSADTLLIERVLLDSISDATMRPEEGYEYVTAKLLAGREPRQDFLVVPDMENTLLYSFELMPDRFETARISTPAVTPAYTMIQLNGSINADSLTDWMHASVHAAILYAGPFDQDLDPFPIGKISLTCEGPATLRAIGDVTGDGIGDVATSQSHPLACFTIYKGVDRGTDVAPRAAAPHDFALGQHHPNPAQRGGHVIVPLEIARGGRYRLALYDLRGAFITKFFESDLPAGLHELPLSLGGLDLRAGFYLLRLTGGGRAHERGLLVR